MPSALIVMAKRPVAGETKTRLCPPLSPEAASNLYEAFLRDTLDLMRQAKNVQRIIAYLPQGNEAYFRKLAPDFELTLQHGDDLGARLDHILTRYLSHGYDKAVAIDSDSPTLPAAILGQAFTALDSADLVLGPCDDGGYYLIGLKHPNPRLLREVPMSTPTVLIDTIRLAKQAKLEVTLLPTWYDVDTAADLERLRAELQTLSNERAVHTRSFLVF